jgi:hypothetical protein
MVKLFSARSLINSPIYDEVPCHWFCIKRDQPVAPYEELLANYHSLEDSEKGWARLAVNELLTEEEVEALQVFLGEHYEEGEVEVREFSLPIQHIQEVYKPFGQRIATREAEITDLRMLWELEGYSLPIEICGYIETRADTKSVEQFGEEVNAHTWFLEKALEHLGLDIDRERIKDAVRKVYVEDMGRRNIEE